MLKPKISMFIILVVSISFIVPLVFPENSEQSEREAMYYRYLEFPSLIKGGSIQPHWMADGNNFWYAEGAPDNIIIYKVDPKANTKAALFDTIRLRRALTSLLSHEPPYKGIPFEKFIFVDGEKAVKFTVENREFICQLDTHKIIRVALKPDLEGRKSWVVPRIVREGGYTEAPPVMELPSPDGEWFLLGKDDNLWLRSSFDGRMRQLTRDGIKDYGWNFEGAQWSSDSFKIAVRKLDSRKVLYSPIIHWLKPKEEIEWWQYPDPGDPIPQTELFIINILNRKQIRIDTGDEPDQYNLILGWRPDGSEALFIRTDREYKKLELIAADPKAGSTRIVLTETQKTFVEFKGFKWLEEGKKFIWISEKDGWAHLYLYGIDGTLISRLTKGNFPVLRVVAVDEGAGWIYFTAHAEKRLYDTHLYRVNFDGKGFTRLTEGIGQHHIQFSPSKKFFIDTHSSLDTPPSVELRTANGKLLRVLSHANIEALKELRWSPPEEFVVKAADKRTDLYGVLYKPFDFDPKKKFPVIEHIYGGPQTTWVPRTFDGGNYGVQPQALAQLGFIVYIVDGRGTPERGKKFQDVVYGKLGRNEIPDHVAVLKQLAEKRPYMDMNKVGIYGNSWGGYFTLRAMLLAPDVYHVGIAGAPVADVYHYIGHEKYLGLPGKNKEGYEYGSNTEIAHKLKGKLLLTIGTSDRNVRFAFTMQMVEAFIRAGKFFDLIVMPGRDHHYGYTGRGRPWHKRTYYIEAMRRYFQEHLKP